MKAKLKSYEFWVSIVSALMVALQSISLKFDVPYIQEIVMGFLGVLAVAGIVKKTDLPAGDDITSADNLPTESMPKDDTQEKVENKK
ncbi:MAG: hypothetical protein K2M75_01925 [Clostridia bacterium]|nr:hypothetical protein [Clostridia bacterium]